MNYLSILGSGVLLVLLTVWIVIRQKKLGPRQLPPGPMCLPLIGNLHNMLGADPAYQSFGRLAHKYGPIMSLKLGRQKPSVIISSSAVAKEAFETHDEALSSRELKDAVQANNHHIFSIVFLPFASTLRKNLRKIFYSNISSGNMIIANQYLRSRKFEELMAYCRQCSQTGEPVDIGQVASDTAINILSNAIFSKDLVDLRADSLKKFKHVIRDSTYQMGKLNLADYFPALKIIDPQGINRLNSINFVKLLRFFGGLIDQRLEQRQKLSQNDRRSTNDILDVLLNMSEEDPNSMDRNQIQHLCLDLFVAGTDSSTTVVEWAMLELMKKPEAMAKAKAELAQVVGENKAVEEADIARLPYLHCVMKETMRIHPPVPLLTRKADQDVQVRGYLVPKDSPVFVNVWSIGRDPAIWDDPLAFNPERFWGSDMDVCGQDFELIPFGVGRRKCPGLPLAIRTVSTMLASLLNSFAWIVEGDLDAEENFGLILAKSRPLLLVPVSL